jgi:hypothetical protein
LDRFRYFVTSKLLNVCPSLIGINQITGYLVPGIEKCGGTFLKDPVANELEYPHRHMEADQHLPQGHATLLSNTNNTSTI